MNTLFKHRKRQLQEELEIDSKILNLIDLCPIVVAKYYFKRREQNRQQYFETLSSSMFNIHSKSLENLREIDNHHKLVLSALDSKNPCQNLSKI